MENNDFLQIEGQKIALILHEKDNVAVTLTVINKYEKCIIRGHGKDYDLQAVEDVAFGHKIAISEINKGGNIYKYGEIIGIARSDIPRGGWIHTHNLYCERGM